MSTYSEAIKVSVEDDQIAGTFLTPESRTPGVLFVHGWGGSQEHDLHRAKGIAGLGCVCLTFDLRGHGGTLAQQQSVSRADNLEDVIAAYDQLASHPTIDGGDIAVVGNSYGSYLASILTTRRPVKWLSLSVPALYRDENWSVPKGQLDREDIAEYRNAPVSPSENRALAACAAFEGDVLIVEAEHDHLIPHATTMSYRRAFERAHSLTHRILDGADHAMSSEACQQGYTSILVGWVTEMVIGRRVGSIEPSAFSKPRSG
ncbi:alpha/beta hydrolase [Halomonas sp. Bachu 37]|uniref:alpha/beta hydrolase family protein n=1 Tax=Halomonas kashgarensis TaxID=3084920 RepID=UPI00321767E8